ncbi:hypothetical protein [Amycolatopsis magusensis]|uniref:hypothetical protein n=1 Tax=Amycolatopsis magusensis TaxID=882444 RepID=UPI0037AA7B93
MSTRSLIGVLNDDGRTFRVRYCHSDGYPTYQLPALGEALHEHHDGDLARLTAALLEHDWSFIAAGEAAAEVADATTRSEYRPSHVQPTAGVGYHYTDHQDPEPGTGSLDEDADGMIAWLYLAAGDEIRVFHAADGRWEHFGDFTVIDLKSLDQAELSTREAAVYDRG